MVGCAAADDVPVQVVEAGNLRVAFMLPIACAALSCFTVFPVMVLLYWIAHRKAIVTIKKVAPRLSKIEAKTGEKIKIRTKARR